MAFGDRSDEVVETYRNGDVIVREGDAGRAMYVIQSGQVRISKHAGDAVVTLAVLGKGDFFGEMSVLESLPRDADAIAIGATRLLVISPGALLVRIRRDPTFAFEMLHRLSGRIRKLNAAVVDARAAKRTSKKKQAAQEAGDPVMMYTRRDADAADDAEPG